MWAKSFNQDIGDWDVNNVSNFESFNSYCEKWSQAKPNFKKNTSQL
jgi:hypothetical protein